MNVLPIDLCPLAVRIGAVILAMWLIPSCKETPREQYERRLREAEKPMQHAVHSDRLLALMAQLKHLTYSRLPQELGSASLTETRVSEIRWIAAGMSSAAEFIPEILRDVELTEEGELEFRRLAEKLRRQCLVLEEMTLGLTAEPNLSTDALVTEFAGILDTCDSCHTRFRVLPRVPRE